MSVRQDDGSGTGAAGREWLDRSEEAWVRAFVRDGMPSAKQKKTISKLPKKTRRALGEEGAKAAKRKRRGE
jgi:hypothetical protein